MLERKEGGGASTRVRLVDGVREGMGFRFRPRAPVRDRRHRRRLRQDRQRPRPLDDGRHDLRHGEHVAWKLRVAPMKRQRQLADVGHVQVEAPQVVDALKELPRRAFEDDLTVRHDHQAVGLVRLAHEMGDGDDRHALFPVEPARHLQHLAASAGIQHRRRFVQHHHLRLHGQHAGDRHPLLLSPREEVRGAQPMGRHVHPRERPVDPPPDFVPRQTQVFRAEGHVFFHDRGDDLVIRVLKDHADGAADVQCPVGFARVPVLDPHVAGVRQQQRIEMLGQRRLARPVVAQDDHIFSLANLQIHPAQRRYRLFIALLVGVMEILDADDGHGSLGTGDRAWFHPGTSACSYSVNRIMSFRCIATSP